MRVEHIRDGDEEQVVHRSVEGIEHIAPEDAARRLHNRKTTKQATGADNQPVFGCGACRRHAKHDDREK
jgi:hypothetical protein